MRWPLPSLGTRSPAPYTHLSLQLPHPRDALITGVTQQRQLVWSLCLSSCHSNGVLSNNPVDRTAEQRAKEKFLPGVVIFFYFFDSKLPSSESHLLAGSFLCTNNGPGNRSLRWGRRSPSHLLPRQQPREPELYAWASHREHTRQVPGGPLWPLRACRGIQPGFEPCPPAPAPTGSRKQDAEAGAPAQAL